MSSERQNFDAALVRAYWLSQVNGTTRLSLRTGLSVRATADFFKETNTRFLILAVGNIWGPNHPSGAHLMRESLVNKYGVQRTRILIPPSPLAKTTTTETQLFLNMARQHSWTKLADIGFSKHQRVSPYLRARGIRVTFFDIENMFPTDSKLSKLTQRLEKSLIGRSYSLYELVKSTAQATGLRRNLDRVADKRRVKPTSCEARRMWKIPMDIYTPCEKRKS